MSENLIGATTAVFPIRLSVAVALPVDVEWSTRDGSAVAGSDYKAASGTVTFLPGETEKQIEVQVYGQAITPSDDKVFFIRLNPPSNAVLVDAVLTCTINIIDDQGIPSVAVVVAEGRRGPKGDPGLSAYEQAVLMGYTGTLTEWMDQIADASKAADRAGDHAVSASEDALKAQKDALKAQEGALKAQNAAKNAVFAGVVFPTAAEGVDPVLGVQNGAYFNVRSPLSEHYIDEYQNVNGVAVATGKSYPTSDYVQDISEHTALPFVLETVYKLNQRVVLINGDIVKSTVDGNTNDPNVDMTGWVYSSLTPSKNLNDVLDKAEARTNLGVYSKAEADAKLASDELLYMPIPYPKSTPPNGYLALMGQAISQATYPILYALYGAILPDLRAYTIRGLDNGRGIDIGRVVLTQQEDAIAEHRHSLITGRNDTGNSHNPGSAKGHVGDGFSPAYNVGDGWIGGVTRASVSFETRVKNVAFLYIVKAG